MTYRTLCIQMHPSKSEFKILKYLTHESKHVYNKTVFIFLFLESFKNNIFKDLHLFIQTHLKDQKNFHKSSLELYNTKMYEIIETYFNYYLTIKDKLHTNNTLIYEFVKKEINDKFIVINNDNFNLLFTFFMIKLNKKIITTKETRFDLLKNILYKILKSMYNTNFNKVKYNRINHKPSNEEDRVLTNTRLIEDVKNKNSLFNIPEVVWKTKIEKDFSEFKKFLDISTILKSNENILGRIVYAKLDTTISSEVRINIIKKAYQSITSFYALKKLGKKCNFPKYLPFDSHYNIVFDSNNTKVINIDNLLYTRLTVGEHLSKNYKEITENDDLICLNSTKETVYKKYVDKKYMTPFNKRINKNINKKSAYIFNNEFIRQSSSSIIDSYYYNVHLPDKINKKDIVRVEIVPNETGTSFKITYTYKLNNYKVEKENELNLGDELEENKEEKDNVDINTIPEDCISIDLGMTNLMTIYDPSGTCYIIKGKRIKELNIFYNNAIEPLIGLNKNNYTLERDHKIKSLLLKRKNTIDNYFNVIVKKLHLLYKNKKKIIIGYNQGWKTNINLGKETNKAFYQIPYRKLINKMFDKFNTKTNIVSIREESYTSKCDAIAFEVIGPHPIYSGKRIRRSLFQSKNGEIINADINGAINIMRKYFTKNGLNMGNKIKGKFYNPVRLTI
jgi:IS605 OrfB family transposase